MSGILQHLMAFVTSVVTDPFWTSVSLLLHGDGTNGAQNNTFIDSSTNNFTVTRSGAPTQGSLSSFTRTAPYSTSVSGGSGYFNGSSQFLSIPNATALQFGTNDFTVECWFYVTSLVTTSQGFLCKWGSNASWEMFLAGTSSGTPNKIVIYIGTGSGGPNNNVIAGATTVAANTWYHFAFTRSSGTLRIFLNGTLDGSATGNTTNFNDTNTLYVGAETGSGLFLNGYLSSARIVNGTAVYTSNFTPPTAPLTAITNTSLLLNFTNAGIYDNAMLNDLVTVGTSQVSTTQVKFGTGSMKFNGTSDWLTAPDTTSLQMGAGDFTIEGWIYLNAIGVDYGIISKGTSSTGWSVNVTSANNIRFSYTASSLTGSTSLAASTWYYFAVVRSGTSSGNVKVYLNAAVEITSGTAITDTFNQTSILYVGASRTGTTPLNGYVDDLRVTKGVARTISTPTAAFPNS